MGSYLELKVFNIGAGFFSSNGSAIADAAGNLSGEMDFGLRCFYDVPVGTKAPLYHLCLVSIRIMEKTID
jgi:hypothetical protein